MIDNPFGSQTFLNSGRGAGKLPNFQCADNNEVFRALLFSLRRKVILPSESWNLRWYLAISLRSKCRPDPAASTAIIEVPVRTSSFEFRPRWLICLPRRMLQVLGPKRQQLD